MNMRQAAACYTPKLPTHCKRPHMEAPVIVSQYIDAGISIAKCYGANRCLLLQELYLKRTFDELLHTLADPLVHEALRKQCQQQLYKPLLALKRFYKNVPNGNVLFLKIQLEARVISHEFDPYS